MIELIESFPRLHLIQGGTHTQLKAIYLQLFKVYTYQQNSSMHLKDWTWFSIPTQNASQDNHLIDGKDFLWLFLKWAT